MGFLGWFRVVTCIQCRALELLGLGVGWLLLMLGLIVLPELVGIDM